MRKLVLMVMAICLASSISAFAGEKKQCKGSAADCKAKIMKSMENRGMIGVDGKWDKEKKGLVIESFFEGSNAEAAGLQKGDILTKINGIAMDNKEETKKDYDNRTPGKTVSVTVDRNGEEKTMNVELIPYPKKVIKMIIKKHLQEYHCDEMKMMKEKKKEMMEKEKEMKEKTE